MNADGLFSIKATPATDAGQTCHVCGETVSWLFHLPPIDAGGPVRCFRHDGRRGLRLLKGGRS